MIYKISAMLAFGEKDIGRVVVEQLFSDFRIAPNVIPDDLGADLMRRVGTPPNKLCPDRTILVSIKSAVSNPDHLPPRQPDTT